LIVVSAGYDAHADDHLAGMAVTANGFDRLATLVLEDALATAAQGRLVGFLEGGYNLPALAESALGTLETWTETKPGTGPISSPCDHSVKRFLGRLAALYDIEEIHG
jgi:acetoin utilization deacetylase AcuC-like enzyme